MSDYPDETTTSLSAGATETVDTTTATSAEQAAPQTPQAPEPGQQPQARQEPAQGTDTEQTSAERPEDEGDAQEPAKDPRGARANRDAAKYRTQLRETEATLETTRAHVTQLEDQILELLAQGQLKEPGDLLRFIDRETLLDEHGHLDVEKAQQAVAELTTQRPELAPRPTRRAPGIRGSSSGTEQSSARALLQASRGRSGGSSAADQLGATGTATWADLLNRDRDDDDDETPVSELRGTERGTARDEHTKVGLGMKRR